MEGCGEAADCAGQAAGQDRYFEVVPSREGRGWMEGADPRVRQSDALGRLENRVLSETAGWKFSADGETLRLLLRIEASTYNGRVVTGFLAAVALAV